MFTGAEPPAIVMPPLPLEVTVIASSPFALKMFTMSIWPSPVAEPSTPCGSIVTPPLAASVPVRSLIKMLSAPPRAWKSILSTSLRSIVMLATSRAKNTRPPLAEISTFSLTLAPMKQLVRPVLALDHVAALAFGFQTKH